MNSAHVNASEPVAQLARIDLNLLVAFDALARERSVTAAAERLGVTQSAMSHTLRRLRELFDDPLLVRGRGGMVFTPRAESLVVPVRSGLVTFARALARSSGFEPQSARRAFCIASPDLFDVLALPTLLERIRDEAPGVDIAIVPPTRQRLADQLETGEIDVAIVPQIKELRGPVRENAPGLVRRTLLRDTFVCLIRGDHPALTAEQRAPRSKALSLETYAALSHALISPGGEGPGPIDRVLEQHGLTRRIALRVPYFHTALAIVAQSDLMLTAPRALTALISDELPLLALPLPITLPEHSVNLVWHERFSSDRGHEWLRALVVEAAATVVRRLEKKKSRGSRLRAVGRGAPTTVRRP